MIRVLWAFVPISLLAQAPSNDLKQGRALFRSNCAFCHGATGQGGRGPNLTSARSTHGRSPAEIRQVIKKGVPGSSMPAFGDVEADDLDRLVLFVKSLSENVTAEERPAGDAMRGRKVYASQGCAACHRVGEEGSDFGPDLTRVGSGRSLAYLRQSLLEPSADIMEEYVGVTVELANGERVSGVRLNEDTYTVQLRDPALAIRMFDKSEVKSVVSEKASLMPPYTALPKEKLDDLVAYLWSLRGQASASETKQREGIR